MSDIRQVTTLIEAAERDISALGGMFDASTFSDEVFGFHAQQAAEKLFKAWLAILDVKYPLTHDLEVLLGLLEDEGVGVERFKPLDSYTPYAGIYRYEAKDPLVEAIERLPTVHLIDVLCLRVKDLLPTDE